MVKIVSPRSHQRGANGDAVRRLQSFAGITLGLRIQWDNFESMVDRLVESLPQLGDTRRFKVAPEMGRHTRTDGEHRLRQLDLFAEGVDAVILGLAA